MPTALIHPTAPILPDNATEPELTLDAQEHATMEILASALSSLSRTGDAQWAGAARELSCDIPLRLRQALRRFSWDAGPEATLVLRNLPSAGFAPGSLTVPASALALLGFALGEIAAYGEHLVEELVPTPEGPPVRGRSGEIALNLRQDHAFQTFRPDFVGLLCLRDDHDIAPSLGVASIRLALTLLPELTRAVLFEERFLTLGRPAPQGLLLGSWEDPTVAVDFRHTMPLGADAKRAMAELGEALRAVRRELALSPGDAVFTDNRLALHGFDSPGWLNRCFVHQNSRHTPNSPPDAPIS